MKRRVTTSLVLALCLLGCGLERVELAISNLPVAEGGCYTVSWIYWLVADPEHGTVYKDDPDDRGANPLYWPPRYTGWRVGTEIEVRDPTGRVVAVTGRRYRIEMGLTPQGQGPQGLVTSAACISEQERP